jgi:hypothetical protein
MSGSPRRAPSAACPERVGQARECHVSPSATPAQSSPPRRFGRLQRPKAAFPFRSGQELAGPTVCCDTRSVGMPTSLTITLRKQQGVGVHREQPPVAQGTRVGLRLLALRGTHVPPARSIGHGSSLEPARTAARPVDSLSRSLWYRRRWSEFARFRATHAR